MTNLRQARDAYWNENGFGPDGGDSLRWVPLSIFGLKLYIPNTEGRRRAVRIHDLHHVLTGYQTDLVGEAEIGAWELASGCRRAPAAFVLNVFACLIVLFVAPRRVRAAWKRGRRSKNLYGVPYDDRLLSRSVDEMRRELGLSR